MECDRFNANCVGNTRIGKQLVRTAYSLEVSGNTCITLHNLVANRAAETAYNPTNQSINQVK
jgi:hypothetical protein